MTTNSLKALRMYAAAAFADHPAGGLESSAARPRKPGHRLFPLLRAFLGLGTCRLPPTYVWLTLPLRGSLLSINLCRNGSCTFL